MCATYPSLIDTGLSMVASDVTELALCIRHMGRHRNRLGTEMRQRSLAVFVMADGDGTDMGTERLVPGLFCQIRGRTAGDASGGSKTLGHDEVVQVHGF